MAENLDFSTMLVHPILMLKSDNIFKDFPILNRFPAFQKDLVSLDKNKVLSYIALVSDMNSPLVLEDDILRRKMQAAELAAFPHDRTGKIHTPYIAVMECRNEIVNSIGISYCRLQHSIEWTELVTYQDILYNYFLQLKNATEATEQKKTTENIQDIKNLIYTTRKIFTAGENNKLFINQIVDDIEYEIVALRPEDIAQKIAKGEEPVNIKPYSKKYTGERFSEKDRD